MASKLSLSLPLRRAHSMDTVPAEDACATEAAEPLSPVTPMLPRRSSLDASLGMLRRISAPALMLAGAPPADATSLLPPQLLDSDKLAYNGLWKKDWAASEDMEPLAAAMALPWIIRKATRLVSHLNLSLNQHEFSTRVAAGGIININEAYQLNGAEGTHARRDLRGGNARGRLELLPRETASQDGSPAGLSIRVTNQWEEPHAGVAVETFSLVGDALEVVTTLTPKNNQPTVSYRAIYRRKH